MTTYIDNNKNVDDKVIVIGALGGSGTRAVAELLRQLSILMIGKLKNKQQLRFYPSI